MILNDLEFLKKYIGTDAKSVFHYTSLDGFKSIVENSSIRFTECCYLNDKKEYLDAIRILDILDEKYQNDDSLKGRLIRDTKKKLDKSYGDETIFITQRNDKLIIDYSKYFVFSTTMKQDSLPMWNYYTKDKSIDGCVISLDVDRLVNSWLKYDNTELVYGKVIYKDDEKIRIIEDALDFVANLINMHIEGLEKYKKHNLTSEEREEEIKIGSVNFFNFFETMRLYFKSQGFEYEQEFRFLLLTGVNYKSYFNDEKNIKEENKIKLTFIPYKGILRSHTDLLIDKNGTLLEVMLSPTSDLDLCKRGVSSILNYYGFVDNENNDIKITKSEFEIR